MTNLTPGQTSRERRLDWVKENSWSNLPAILPVFPAQAVKLALQEYGLDWFTDEQVEDMTNLMVAKIRKDMRFQRRQREAYRAHQEAMA